MAGAEDAAGAGAGDAKFGVQERVGLACGGILDVFVERVDPTDPNRYITPDGARWTQRFSFDDGATWETNWTMSFKRMT